VKDAAMNTMEKIRPRQHPFLDGKPKRMLIDCQWVEAASRGAMPSIPPKANRR
jgi:hypothetical protein